MIYGTILHIRNLIYNHRKPARTEVPSICIGNITVGGTGKTPMTEAILGTLMSSEDWKDLNVAVLSRGYKRRSKGFQQLPLDGSAGLYGDEPMQMKRKFPSVTVAVDKDRVRGCSFLCHPELLEGKKGRGCLDKDFKPSDLIILDDAFQYRKLKADVNIVLVDHSRPVTKDRLLPFGRLRDLKCRLYDADVVIVTKCPYELDGYEKAAYASLLGFKSYDAENCTALTPKGKICTVLFTMTEYLHPSAIYPESDSHYVYSHKAILFTGIANDKPLMDYLSGTYKIVSHIPFRDHHTFSKADVREIAEISAANPTAVVMTTEKDAQRMVESKHVTPELRSRMFCIPIRHRFFSDAEESIFRNILIHIRPCA